MNGRRAEAKEVLIQAAICNGTILPDDFQILDDENDAGSAYNDRDTFRMAKLVSWRNMKVAIPLWTVWFCFGATYYGVVLFSGRLFEDSDESQDDDKTTCSFDYLSMFLRFYKYKAYVADVIDIYIILICQQFF